ncbi:hypothetical protein JOD54_004933 [Actinokineospora baliensis]|nr:hypothetical protein [Actinokineospora baliensis]
MNEVLKLQTQAEPERVDDTGSTLSLGCSDGEGNGE